MEKYKINYNYNKDTNNQEIEVIANKKLFDKFFELALDEFTKTSVAPGFRKGKVPKNQVLSKNYFDISNRAIEKLSDDALKTIYSDLDPRPLDTIKIISVKDVEKEETKEKSEPTELCILLSYLPQPKVVLTDLEKVKVAEVEPKEASKEEIEKELLNIWFSYAGKLNKDIKKEDFKKELLTEEFFMNSGITKENDKIKSYDDMYNFIKDYIENIYKQSAMVDWEKAVMQVCINESKYEFIEGLIEKELEERYKKYIDKFIKAGMNPDEYLEKTGVKKEDLINDWRETATSDLKKEIFLQEYGKTNKLFPTKEELEAEVAKIDPATKKSYNNDIERLNSLVVYYYINNKAYINIMEKMRAKIKK